MPPAANTKSLFAHYDLDRQQRIMRLVRDRSPVPAPQILWNESDTTFLGSPFLVMPRYEGLVPGDVPLYTFQSFLTEASPEQLDTVERESIQVLADLHSIALTPADRELLDLKIAGKTPLERQFNEILQHYEWTCNEEGLRSDLLERTYTWIKANWPADEGEPVLVWGDPRMANFMFRDHRVVAALDWEMAGLGVPEQDVCWPVMFHGWHQDLTIKHGLTGLPNFMRLRKVVALYEAASGRKLNNLRFHLIFALGRLGPIMLRSLLRAIKYGQSTMPETTDGLLLFRDGLEKLLAGEAVWE